MGTKIIVGLGNPGPEYETTRHNLGFLTLDAFAKEAGFDRGRKRFQAICREKQIGDHAVILVKPLTYMNLSGSAVRDLLAFRRLTGGSRSRGAESVQGADPDTDNAGAVGEPRPDFRDLLLVIYDDLDMPLGRLRYRARGSSGGHRGLCSVMDELRTERFSRLKIGIGRDDRAAAEDYVLEGVQGEEKEALMRAAFRAAATIPVWLEEGVVSCANRFNGPE